MLDKELRQAVLDELSYEPSVNAAHIGVTAEGGVVTLMGHVETYWEKVSAEKAASRVKGVRGVANDVVVKLPQELKETDEKLAQRALSVLSWDTAVPKDSVQVHVQSGYVTLTGQVDCAFQRALAETDVRKLHGVVLVTNQIAVKPLPQASASEVRQKIVDALKRSVAEATSAIHVQAAGGKVTLSGAVHDWRERVLAERAAWSAPGVTQVEDKLAIA